MNKTSACIIVFMSLLSLKVYGQAKDNNDSRYHKYDTLIVKIPGKSPTSKILVFSRDWKSATEARNYTNYHLGRIKADKEIFVDKNYSKGLSLYTDIFKRFDFAFLSDCIVAMQIALFVNDEKLFLEFVEKATKNGLVPRHLTHLSYVKVHPIFIKNKDRIVEFYQRNREGYLSRLDTATLTQMYRLYVIDQTQKNTRKGETNSVYLRRYRKEINQTITELEKLVNEGRFPGEKLIGIDQNDIMRELKTGKPDIQQYRLLYKDIGDYVLPQMKLDEMSFASTVLVPPIIHFVNIEGSQAMHKFLTEDRYFQELAKGTIHPNDYAAFNDCAYLDDLGEPKTPNFEKGDKYFGVLGRVFNVSVDKVDSLRTRYFLSPLSVVEAKAKFMKGQRMHCNMGWDGSYTEYNPL